MSPLYALLALLSLAAIPAERIHTPVETTAEEEEALRNVVEEDREEEDMFMRAEENAVVTRCQANLARPKVQKERDPSALLERTVQSHSHVEANEVVNQDQDLVSGMSGAGAATLSYESMVHGLWYRNASLLSMIDKGEASFTNWKCNFTEYKAWRKRFGLDGKLDKCHLETNFGEREPCPSGNILWFYPKADHNRAFCTSTEMCFRVTMWSNLACSFQLVRIGDLTEAVEALEKYPDNSIEHAVVGGHGDGVKLTLGTDPIFGDFTVQGFERPIWTSAVVTVKETVETKNVGNHLKLEPGTVGKVQEIDEDGDALIDFEGVPTYHYISRSDFEKLSATSPVDTFISKLRQKMHQHSTIMVDSCNSANSSHKPNLAEYTAMKVDKGIRVMGAQSTIAVVRVKRFHNYHAKMQKPNSDEKTDPDYYKEYQALGAKCPRFSSSRELMANGNCACPKGTRCKTASGELCPVKGGGESDREFLPACAEDWAADKCSCIVHDFVGRWSKFWHPDE